MSWRLAKRWLSGAALVAASSACGGSTESQAGRADSSAANGGAKGATPSGHAGEGTGDITASDAGTAPNNTAGGGSPAAAPWDPFATLPDALGPVEGPAATVPDSCCSRRGAATRACPPGADVAAWGTIAKAGDTVVLTGTLATVGTSFQVTALAAPSTGPAAVALVESAVAPPVGVADTSPVYRVDAKVTLPALAVSVPMTSNQHQFAASSTGLYFSVDGASFQRVDDSYQNAGFLQGTLPGAGFVFAGSSPGVDDCR